MLETGNWRPQPASSTQVSSFQLLIPPTPRRHDRIHPGIVNRLPQMLVHIIGHQADSGAEVSGEAEEIHFAGAVIVTQALHDADHMIERASDQPLTDLLDCPGARLRAS